MKPGSVALVSARGLVLAATFAMLATVLGLGVAGSARAQVAVNDQTVEEHTDGSEIQFAYPEIGIPSDDAMLQDFVQALLSEYRMAVAARSSNEPPYSARLSYSVTRNDERAVALVFDYSLYTGGAHPNFTRRTFNFLMPDGTRVFLPDLVGSDGIHRVSDLAIADLSTRLGASGYADPNWIRSGAGPYADNFDSFEWLPTELVLHFDPYAVASYAEGPQQVVIPRTQLQAFIRPEPRAPLPSFDCSEVSTAIENAICSDQALAQLDRRVAEAYATRLRLEAIDGQPQTVQAQQIAWLSQRDDDCSDQTDVALVDCLRDEYSNRLLALQRFS